MTPKQMHEVVTKALSLIDDASLRDCLAPLMVPPRCEMREWDYGASGERFACWVVLEHQASNTCIAYCEHGFGPADPWGLPPLSDPQPIIGPDSAWFSRLEDAFRQSAAWSGQNPSTYVIP